MKPPPIAGIVETILYTADLPGASAFYRDVLGFEPMTGNPARFQSFQVGAHDVLLLFKKGTTLEPTTVPGGIIPPHDGSGPHHIGFAVAGENYERWREYLAARGIAVESETHWPRGGRSLYFRDPDQHLVELVTPGIWPNY